MRTMCTIKDSMSKNKHLAIISDIMHKEEKPTLKETLPEQWWNSTNNSSNPSVNWMNLLQWSVYKGIKHKIRSCKPSSQQISLQQPCHGTYNISPTNRIFQTYNNNLFCIFIKLDRERAREFMAPPSTPKQQCQLDQQNKPRWLHEIC